MNTGPEQPGREPLTPEEREWAQRLSRLGPSAGPPSAADARILAAAHDAVAARPRPRAHDRGRRRWPVALGVAASLALAVGIAWRLRPLPEPPAQVSAESDAAAARGSGGPAAVPEFVPLPQAPMRSVAAPPPPAEPMKQAAAEEGAKRADKAEAVQQAPIVFDEYRAADAAAAPAPAAPPPPPPPAPAAEAEAANAAANADLAATAAPAQQEEKERMQKAAEAVAAQRAKSLAPPAGTALRREAQAQSGLVEDVQIAGSDAGDEPPAYANSPQVREAWLQRIRELVAEGHPQEAHDSLDEFKRRYPEHPLPEDLKRFEQSKHDSATP